jgi:ribonuclease-3
MWSPFSTFRYFFSAEKDFIRRIYGLTGQIPREVFLYKLALTHSSNVRRNRIDDPEGLESAKMCNERLEFLGDSILDAVIADYLFKIYPYKDEGFLTEMRSKIVNRKSLNDICRQLKLHQLILHKQSGAVNESMYGDALEAFIGALFLDHGFDSAKQFIHRRIIDPLIELGDIESQVISYKNKLIEYVQKARYGILTFEVIEENDFGQGKVFRIQAMVGEKVLGVGEGKNKKTAEQRASEDALQKLNALA